MLSMFSKVLIDLAVRPGDCGSVTDVEECPAGMAAATLCILETKFGVHVHVVPHVTLTPGHLVQWAMHA